MYEMTLDCCRYCITMAVPVRSVGRFLPNSTALFLCDMQVLRVHYIFARPIEINSQVKFRPSISHFDEVVSNSSRVLEAAKIMSLPCLATEQYPKGLGPTVEELGLAKHSITPFPKTCFTMIIPELMEALKAEQEETKSVILCGIETHACIHHTAIDLIERGIEVWLKGYSDVKLM